MTCIGPHSHPLLLSCHVQRGAMNSTYFVPKLLLCGSVGKYNILYLCMHQRTKLVRGGGIKDSVYIYTHIYAFSHCHQHNNMTMTITTTTEFLHFQVVISDFAASLFFSLLFILPPWTK